MLWTILEDRNYFQQQPSKGIALYETRKKWLNINAIWLKSVKILSENWGFYKEFCVKLVKISSAFTHFFRHISGFSCLLVIYFFKFLWKNILIYLNAIFKGKNPFHFFFFCISFIYNLIFEIEGSLFASINLNSFPFSFEWKLFILTIYSFNITEFKLRQTF